MRLAASHQLSQRGGVEAAQAGVVGGAYPMVAAAYSERRSALARGYGLGRKSEGAAAVQPANVDEAARVVEPAGAPPSEEQVSAEPSPRKRGHPARKKVAAEEGREGGIGALPLPGMRLAVAILSAPAPRVVKR